MNECEYPSFPQPPTDRGRAQASTVLIGNLVDPKSRVKPEDLLAIRELSDMHAFIYCKESEVQAGETLFQESLSHLDISSSYHRIRW